MKKLITLILLALVFVVAQICSNQNRVYNTIKLSKMFPNCIYLSDSEMESFNTFIVIDTCTTPNTYYVVQYSEVWTVRTLLKRSIHWIRVPCRYRYLNLLNSVVQHKRCFQLMNPAECYL